MPCSVPSRTTPAKAIDGPAELDAPDAADGGELGRLDQVERVGHHHRGERRLRHQADERRQHEQRRERRGRGHERRELRARSRLAIDRRLRRAAAGRHRAEQAAGRVGGAEREQLAVGPRPRLAGRRERARRGNALGKAHEGDAGCRRPHDPTRGRGAAEPARAVRPRPRRRPPRPTRSGSSAADAAIASPMATSGAGARGTKCSSAKISDEHAQRHAAASPWRYRARAGRWPARSLKNPAFVM